MTEIFTQGMKQMGKKLIFATHNQGKVVEIKQILGEGYDVFSLKDLDVHTEIEENGTSKRRQSVK